MAGILMLNGSPRAPRSNSKAYAALFSSCWSGEKWEATALEGVKSSAPLLPQGCDHLLLVFPLYADGLPVSLMKWLQQLEQNPPQHKPTVHILINCGFLEPKQNEVAVDMIRLFCKKHGYSMGSVLCIGGGEAILRTPFAFMARCAIKKLAQDIASGQARTRQVTMPLSKGLFLKASRKYWINLGASHGNTPEDLATMEIEGK